MPTVTFAPTAVRSLAAFSGEANIDVDVRIAESIGPTRRQFNAGLKWRVQAQSARQRRRAT